VLESAPAPRTTVQSPLRWSTDPSWKLDYSNIERLSPAKGNRQNRPRRTPSSELIFIVIPGRAPAREPLKGRPATTP
jgi:hypothetical protein